MLFRFHLYCTVCGPLTKFRTKELAEKGFTKHQNAYKRVFGETDHRISRIVDLEEDKKLKKIMTDLGME